MLIYYAVGGGLGHVTRARKVLNALKQRGKIITALSSVPASLCSAEDVLQVPACWASDPRRLMLQLTNWLDDFAPDGLLFDTFPAGIRGEIDRKLLPPELRLDYVARYVNWPRYQHYLSDPLRFQHSYNVEILHPLQAEFVSNHCDQSINLSLLPLGAQSNARSSTGYWLLAHSGPAAEIRQLLAYANALAQAENVRPDLLVCTQIEPAYWGEIADSAVSFSSCEVIAACPANGLFASASRLISAAGFNVMHESESIAYKHHVLPFERKFDDQFERLRRRRLGSKSS